MKRVLAIPTVVNEFAELHFKSGSWVERGIPESGCWMRRQTLEGLLAGSDPIDGLLYGLMDWLDVTEEPKPASRTLQLLLDRHYPPDDRNQARCEFAEPGGPSYVVNVSSDLDCTGQVVAWQRQRRVIAVARASKEQGRMTVAAPGPISLKVAKSIFNHSLSTFMLEPYDSFVGARASCGATGNLYRWTAGLTTLHRWDYGLGVEGNSGERICVSDYPPICVWLPPRQLAAQIAIAAGYR